MWARRQLQALSCLRVKVLGAGVVAAAVLADAGERRGDEREIVVGAGLRAAEDVERAQPRRGDDRRASAWEESAQGCETASLASGGAWERRTCEVYREGVGAGEVDRGPRLTKVARHLAGSKTKAVRYNGQRPSLVHAACTGHDMPRRTRGSASSTSMPRRRDPDARQDPGGAAGPGRHLRKIVWCVNPVSVFLLLLGCAVRASATTPATAATTRST